MLLRPLLPAPLRNWMQGRAARRVREDLRRRCPVAAAAAEALPDSLRETWAARASEEFGPLRTDPEAWALASAALAQFFEVCRLQATSGEALPCGLPSRAADSVWHVALRWHQGALSAWQLRHFGRVVEHRENAALGVPVDEALARTWVWACRSEGIPPSSSGLPLVFTVDRRLNMPGGWAYSFDPRRLGLSHQDIDERGRLQTASYLPAALTLSALGAAGLLTAVEHAQADELHAAVLARAARRKQDGGSCGSSCGGSSDGGGDSGGSSCGGGCGGGGD